MQMMLPNVATMMLGRVPEKGLLRVNCLGTLSMAP